MSDQSKIQMLEDKIKTLTIERDHFQTYYMEKFEFMKNKYNDLADSIQDLIKFVAIDAKSGKDPCIYQRGNLWRYHTDRAKNQWHDHENPATAALIARIKV